MVDITHSLASYQSAFAAFLLAPQLDAATHTALQPWLSAQGSTTTPSRGQLVYRNNVLYSLTQALAAQFPVVERLVGKDFFATLARDFICAHPPATPSLMFYGEGFAAHIERDARCAPAPYLADVATLELACQYALHANDDKPLTAAELLQLPPEQLPDYKFALQASASLLHSRWPVQLIREENLKDFPATVELAGASPVYLLVYRRGETVQIVTLQEPAFVFLQALQQGQTLQQAWEILQQRFTIPDAELIPLLTYLLSLELFTHPPGAPT